MKYDGRWEGEIDGDRKAKDETNDVEKQVDPQRLIAWLVTGDDENDGEEKDLQEVE